MADTAIEWTDTTWNPTTGCDKVSDGCDNCYAMALAKRLKGMGSAKYQRDGDPRTSGPGFGLTEHPSTLAAPMRWQKPRKVFVNSMSDLFHDDVSWSFQIQVFAAMAATPQHTYQILTKRHGPMRSRLNEGGFRASVWDRWRSLTHGTGEWTWPLPNVWLGISAEDHRHASLRIPALLQTPAAVRFVSAEPLLGPIDFTALNARNGAAIDCLNGDVKGRDGSVYAACPSAIDWVIAGGESGPAARPVEADWVRSIRDQVAGTSAAFLFKQWGGRTPKSGGRELDGQIHDEYPAVAA